MGDELGYVPREYAEDFAPLLDAGARQDFTVKKCLETASGRTIPVVRGAFYSADSTQGRSTREATPTSPGQTARPAASARPAAGCLGRPALLSLAALTVTLLGTLLLP